MVQPTIADEEDLAAALFPVHHAGQVDARLDHQPASKLQREPGIRQHGRARSQRLAKRRANAFYIQRLVARKIGNAETAAEVDERRGNTPLQIGRASWRERVCQYV